MTHETKPTIKATTPYFRKDCEQWPEPPLALQYLGDIYGEKIYTAADLTTMNVGELASSEPPQPYLDMAVRESGDLAFSFGPHTRRAMHHPGKIIAAGFASTNEWRTTETFKPYNATDVQAGNDVLTLEIVDRDRAPGEFSLFGWRGRMALRGGSIDRFCMDVGITLETTSNVLGLPVECYRDAANIYAIGVIQRG